MNIEKRIPGIPEHWQNYCLSLMFHMFLPLLPLIFELWKVGKVEVHSLMLAASLYAISIGVSSRSKLFFGIGVIVGLFFAGAYGLSFNSSVPLPSGAEYSIAAISGVFFFHSLERWNIHIVDKEPYWLF